MLNNENVWNNSNLIQTLKNGGVVVMPTDTIYGLVGLAENESTVNRIYDIRNRDLKKPCIILIGDIEELKKFSINLTEAEKNKLMEFWPGPVSVVLDCDNSKLAYLHKSTNTLAFRIPAQEELRALLVKTGPLVAPSANLATRSPSETMDEAREYFGDKVDLYEDGGLIKSKASRVIRLHKDGGVSILRS